MNNNTVVVIGNGFDIDLGWDTSYRSFYNAHKGWEMHRTSEDDLFQYVIKHVADNWFDFERTLYDYAIHRSDSDVKYVERDKNDYETFRNLLNSFLANKSKEQINKESYAYQLLQAYIKQWKRYSPRPDLILKWFSFNYTPLIDIAKEIDSEAKFNYIPVHGTLDRKNIIFGVHDDNRILPQYRYLQKSMDDAYESHGIVSALMDANLIVFFGLSMGFIDGVYFENVLKQISNVNSGKNNKEIVIITRDNQTKRDIKSNLQDMGLNPQVLFNMNRIEFILTSEYTESSKEKFKALLSKL